MWWSFKNAFVRKIAYFLAAMLMAFMFGHKAHATTYVWNVGGVGVTGVTGTIADGQAACAALAAGRSASFNTTTNTGDYFVVNGVPVPGVPTSLGQVLACSYQHFQVPAGCNPCASGDNISSVVGTLPSCSSSSGNLDLMVAVGGSLGYTSGGGYCYGGCEYTNGNLVVTFGSTAQRLAGKAVPTGLACGAVGSASGGDAPATNVTCASASPTSAAVGCVDSTNGRGTFSVVATATPDVVQPQMPATPDSCVSYASGGVACNADAPITSPPAPSTAQAPTVPAVPAMTVVASGHTETYYTPIQVAASKSSTGTQAASGGAPAGTTAGTAPGGGGGGSAPSAANGDCGASSVDCAADGSVPSLTRADTIQSNVQSYMDAVAAAPIVVAMSGISSAWPTASCPSVPFTLWSHSFDMMAPVCTVWGTDVAPTLSLVFLAIWAVAGIRVVLSA